MRLAPQTPLTENDEIVLFMLVFYLQRLVLYHIIFFRSKWVFSFTFIHPINEVAFPLTFCNPSAVTARCKAQGSLSHGLAVSSELTGLLYGVPLRAPVGFEPTTPGWIIEGTVRPSPARL